MVTTPLRVVLAAVWALSVAQAATVVLVDSAVNTVVRHTQNVELDTKTLCAADAALLRLQPPFQLHGSSAQQVEKLFSAVSTSPEKHFLVHPTAFLFVNLFGLGVADGKDFLLSSIGGSKFSLFNVPSGKGVSVIEALQDLAQSNLDVPFHHLDRFTSQACDESCVAGLLKELLPIIGGELSQDSGLDGVLKVLSTELQLKQPAARLFATELAMFYRSAKAVLSSNDNGQDVLVMDVLFSDLAALVDGNNAAAAKAAVHAIMQVVGWIQNEHEAKNKGHFAYQVALLEKVADSHLEQLMQPKPMAPSSRRLTAKTSTEDFDEAKAVVNFSKRAACYGAAFLLVYFTFAGIYCLTAMDFKQDTLLYSKGKVD